MKERDRKRIVRSAREKVCERDGGIERGTKFPSNQE